MRFHPLKFARSRLSQARDRLRIAGIRWRYLIFEIDPKYGFFFLYIGIALMSAGLTLHFIALREEWIEWSLDFLVSLGAAGAGAAGFGMTLIPSLRSRDANGRPELIAYARERIELLRALVHRAEIEKGVRPSRRKPSSGRRL